MTYSLKRDREQNTKYFVVDEDGNPVSEPESFEDASARHIQLTQAEQQRLEADPVLRGKRYEKKLYRQANGNPWLLAIFFPRKGTKLRHIGNRWNREFRQIKPQVEKLISGDITPDQYRTWADSENRTDAATEARLTQGARTKQAVERLRTAGKSNKEIARELGISERHVKRLR